MNLLKDKEFMNFMGMEEQAKLVHIRELVDEMILRAEGGGNTIGDTLPWKKTHDKVRLRPGEVSVWAGINGHGKSLLVGQVLLFLPPEHQIVIASLEMPAPTTALRMCQQSLPSGKPTADYIREFAEKTDNFHIYTELSTVPADRILALVNYAGAHLKARHIMIDSMVKCSIRNDDFDQQKTFVDSLCQLAKAYNMHIHLVHHMKKRDKETTQPDKFDVRGAGEITDLVDNVFLVHRNKEKERKIENKQHVNEMESDTRLICEKQRHGEYEGTIALYFDKTSHQFMGGPNSRLRWG